MTKIGISKIGHGVVLILLFFAAMNFQSKFYYFALGAAIVMALCTKVLRVEPFFIIYLLLSVLMGLYNVDNGMLAIIRPVAFAAVYLVGYNLSQNHKTGETSRGFLSVNKSYSLLKAVAWGSFVHFLLNYFISIGTDVGRNTTDIWTGEVFSATGQAALSCLMLGLSVAMILLPAKRSGRVLGIAALILMFSYNLILATRTMFVIVAAVFMVGSIYYLKNTKNISQRARTAYIVLTIVFAFIVIFIALVSANIFGLQSLIFESNLFERFAGFSYSELLDSDRLGRKMFYIRNMFRYPFGGFNMRRSFGYAHDLLLDAYDEYGALSLILLIMILIKGIKNLITFCKNDRIAMPYRISFLCVYTAVLLEFCVEPIFAGMPWLFVCYSLINGCIAGINISYRQKKSIPGESNLNENTAN